MSFGEKTIFDDCVDGFDAVDDVDFLPSCLVLCL